MTALRQTEIFGQDTATGKGSEFRRFVEFEREVEPTEKILRNEVAPLKMLRNHTVTTRFLRNRRRPPLLRKGAI